MVPKSAPKPIGAPRRGGGLAKLEWDAPLNQAMIVVGRKKGLKKARNLTGACAQAPTEFKASTVDKWFRQLRAAQVGAEKVAGTRIEGGGWYDGNPEPSMTYQVIHDPYVKGERKLPAFEKRMRELAENLADVLCQDEVLVVMDTAKGKHTYSYSAVGKRRR